RQNAEDQAERHCAKQWSDVPLRVEPASGIRIDDEAQHYDARRLDDVMDVHGEPGDDGAKNVHGDPLGPGGFGSRQYAGAARPAAPLRAARGLLASRALDQLAGRAVFFSVPAEEYGDMEWRVAQARAGKLEFLGGKPELLRLGHFDDVDLAMMIHTTSRAEEGKAGVPASNNGCIVKTVRYIGRAAHAGGAPHMGINALYAAQIGLMSINAVRETFRDEDTIRVHPIITHGGSQVNVIPGEVRIETYVRGRTMEEILDANVK